MSQNLSSAAFHQGLQFAKVLIFQLQKVKEIKYHSGFSKRILNVFIRKALLLDSNLIFFFLCACVCGGGDLMRKQSTVHSVCILILNKKILIIRLTNVVNGSKKVNGIPQITVWN